MDINKVLASFKSITKLKAYRTVFNLVVASSLLSISSGVYARTGDMVPQNQRIQTDATPYIIGGTTVPAGQRTFQIYLSVQGQQYCGGSIIADNWVLTAAHCVDGTNIDTVVAGTQSLTSGGQRFSIAQIITHPQWVSNGFGTASDLALIKINGTFATNLERLKLATPAIMSSLPSGTKGTVSGWGLTRGGDNNSQSNQLLQTSHTILSDSQCAALDGGNIDSSKYVCAQDARVSACNGDSGGPFTIVSNNVTYSAGIVSFGPTSCNTYTAYSKTAAFVDWIQSQIGTSSGGGGNPPPPPPPPPPGPTPSACPSGFTSFTGVIGASGQAVPTGEYNAPAGVHASTNAGGTRVRLDLYKRGWYNWARVASSTSSINYRGYRGTYALTVNGAPNTPYSVCARRP